jgi:hypothetical protein
VRTWEAALAALALAAPAAGGSRQVELGLEDFYYRTAETPLNRGNLLGLRRDEDLLRAVLNWREMRGRARLVFRGFVERRLAGGTEWIAREAYAQYAWGEALSLRVGKQRVAWGSGFAWNPSNRVERPKNPLNTGLEQEGALAARADWIPSARAGVIALVARSDNAVGDLPFDPPRARRRTHALRARLLVKDTDAALIVSGGPGQRTLLGLDVGRALGWGVTVHAEASAYRGAELPPAREGRTFVRVATGALRTVGAHSTVALEYFFNGEGYDDAGIEGYLAGLDAAYARARAPEAPEAVREAALREYLAGAGAPYAGGLGLRRHYLHASWTRAVTGGRWSTALRALAGLDDGGVVLTPGLGFAPRDDLSLHLDGVLLLGPARSEYRLAPLRGAVQARARVSF